MSLSTPEGRPFARVRLRLALVLALVSCFAAPTALSQDDALDAAVARLGSRDPAEREAAIATLHAAGSRAIEALDRAERALDTGAGALETRLAIRRLRLRIPVPRVLVRVPAGPFLFGPGRGQERTLPEFLIDRTEVTNFQYKQFIDATRYPHLPQGARRGDAGWDATRRTYREGTANHPVVGVSFDDARAYAAWAGLRLPTEEEWEKACRGTDGRRFPWGDEADARRGRFGASSPAPVASHPLDASPYGVLDMAGNVNEWTSTASSETPGYLVLKGGYFGLDPGALEYAQADKNDRNAPGTRAPLTGFRCAQDP